MSADYPPDQEQPGNDNEPRISGQMRDDFVMALRLYSRLPTGQAPHEPPSLSRIALALPFASLVIGIVPAIITALLILVGLPSLLAAAFGVAALVVISGAMAEDGLADSFDGLFGGVSTTTRLTILKDSRHGSYGVAALCLFLVARVAALGALADTNVLAMVMLWLAAGIWARSGALWLTLALPPARADGASAAAGRPSRQSFIVGLVFTAVIGFVLAAPFTGVFGLIVTAALVTAIIVGWTALCRHLVEGQTGDLIGALGGLLEIAVLSCLLIFV